MQSNGLRSAICGGFASCFRTRPNRLPYRHIYPLSRATVCTAVAGYAPAALLAVAVLRPTPTTNCYAQPVISLRLSHCHSGALALQLPFSSPHNGLPISGFPLYDLTRGRRRSRFILVFGAAYDFIIDILLPSSHPQHGSYDLDTKARLSLPLPGIQADVRRSGSLLPCSRKPKTDRGP